MKIALVKFNALGDMIIGSVGFRIIRIAFPDAEITLYTYSYCREIVKNNPDIDKFVYVDSYKFKGKNIFTKLLIEIFYWRKTKYDLVVSFHPSAGPNIIARFLKSKYYVLPNKGQLNLLIDDDNKSFKHGLNHYKTIFPEISKFALNLFNKSIDSIEILPVLYLDFSEKEHIESTLIEKSLILNKYIAVFPGGGTNMGEVVTVKRYPYYFEILNRILRYKDIKILILGGPGDSICCRELENKINNKRQCINLQGKTNLQQLIWLIESSKFLLTNDTCALHIAIARNKPIITIFGPTDPNELVLPRDNISVFKPVGTSSCYFGKFHGDSASVIKSYNKIDKNLIVEKIFYYWNKY
ncbi:MAG TPA: glycosyltransferase family 9 protein [Victivallales bacterium]|nr:glycosyltransferase family 9 protein [Victivallales bacterium]